MTNLRLYLKGIIRDINSHIAAQPNRYGDFLPCKLVSDDFINNLDQISDNRWRLRGNADYMKILNRSMNELRYLFASVKSPDPLRGMLEELGLYVYKILKGPQR